MVWCGFPSGFLLSVKCLIDLVENGLIIGNCNGWLSLVAVSGTLALPLCSFGYRTVKVLADSNGRSTQRKTFTVAGQWIFGVAKLNGQVLGQFTRMVQAKHEFKFFGSVSSPHRLTMQYRTMCYQG